ncbi:MAG: pyridoxal phosphate-dependent aminotransferase [Deltaproteobacteria bacterium]|nr:pyridoxal phosphate-dependent aminotransferase [Deltaproteobacteria bacterium]
MKLSKRVLELEASVTLAMKAKSKALADQGISVISLSAGEPDFETPSCIVQAAHKALDAGVSRYTAVRGNDDLISAMRHKFKRDQNLDYDATQVISSCGAKSSLSMAFDAVLSPGDEAIILTPYWVSYPDMVKLTGAKPVFAQPSIESIEQALSEKTRVIIVNSPNNPSGQVLPKSFFQDLMKKLEGTDVWVISDEIYEHLVFDDARHISPASLSKDAYSRTIVINGVSKGYAMTGWRVGITAGPKEVIGAMTKLQGQRYTCIPTIAQKAAAYALSEPPELQTEIEKMRSAYQERRDKFLEEISKIPNVKCSKPQGAFYAFPDFSAYGDDIALAEKLLGEAHVSMVPGSAFGAPGHLRISLAASEEDIVAGVQKIGAYLSPRT